MDKRISVYMFIMFLFFLTTLVSENPVLAQTDSVPEITLTATSELGGPSGKFNYSFDHPWAWMWIKRTIYTFLMAETIESWFIPLRASFSDK